MALFTHERITTTLGKAKEMRPFAEKLITLSKKDTLAARRRVARHIRSKKTVKKLFETLGPRYAERPGGYTRLYHLGHRPGDAADTALVELVGALDGADSADATETETTSTAAATDPAAASVPADASAADGETDAGDAGEVSAARGDPSDGDTADDSGTGGRS